MIKDAKYDIYFYIGKDEKRFLGIFLIPQKKRIEKNLIAKNYKIAKEPYGFDIVVTGDALKHPEKYGKALLIHLDHGVGIKTLRIRNIVKQKNYRYHVFLEGQYWYDYIKSLNWENKANFYITGIPKLDMLFWENYYDNNLLIKKIGLNPNKKNVLFSPSYKPSCIKYIKEKILELIPEYNLIIKLHPYSWGGKYASNNQSKFYLKLAKKHPELFLIPQDDYDIYPYLYLADTLISDTSSVINEFLALGKFGIIYLLPENNIKHSDGMEVLSVEPRDWLKDAFVHIDSPNQLGAAVKLALNPTEKMKVKLEEYKNYFFAGLDGNSAQRVKIKIDELVSKL